MMTTTAVKTTPRYKLSSGGSSKLVTWMAKAMKQRMAPIQRRVAKPEGGNICHENSRMYVVGFLVSIILNYFIHSEARISFTSGNKSNLFPSFETKNSKFKGRSLTSDFFCEN